MLLSHLLLPAVEDGPTGCREGIDDAREQDSSSRRLRIVRVTRVSKLESHAFGERPSKLRDAQLFLNFLYCAFRFSLCVLSTNLQVIVYTISYCQHYPHRSSSTNTIFTLFTSTGSIATSLHFTSPHHHHYHYHHHLLQLCITLLLSAVQLDFLIPHRFCKPDLSKPLSTDPN
jgi:hypothetical protein